MEDKKKSLILIVDDNMMNLQVLGNILGKNNYDIAISTNGNEAINYFNTETADLVLLDIMMPNISGYEVCEKIKNNQKTKNVPIIFLTAKTDKESIIKGFKAGAVDYLTKPFNEAELFARVKTHIELKKSKENLELLVHERTKELNEVNKELKKKIETQRKYEKVLEEAKMKAEESNDLKSAFLSNMSHEVRTPMNGIIGFAELLVSSTDDDVDKKKKYINIIKSRCKDLTNIIEDIIMISKIETRQMEMFETEFSLNETLQEIYNKHKSKLASINKDYLEFIISTALNEEKSKIKLDKHKLIRILNDLISNAIKFTIKGKIRVGYKLKDESTLLFYVSDTGIGIPEDKLEVIFESFRQTQLGLSREYQGIGLGLTISKNFVDLLGGKMWIESKIDKGTTVYFTVPYIQVKSVTPRISKEIKPGKNLINKKTRILIIEDDEASIGLLDEILKNTEANTDFAMTGVEAKGKLDKNKYDVILLDIQLPDVSGLEIIKYAKEKCPEIVIIAQSAFTLKDKVDLFLEQGCDDFIAKPIDADRLLQKINNQLSKSQK